MANVRNHLKTKSFLPLVACLLISACAPQGDFGRPKANALNDSWMPYIGNYAAEERLEPVSWFDMTDDEKEMRSLGYILLMPAHPRDRRNQFWAELRRTRITDSFKHVADPKGYCTTLLGEKYTSSHTRYAKLYEDIRADRARLPPFCAKANQVLARDEVRQQAINALPSMEKDDRKNGKDRILENRMVIDWVRLGLKDHLEGYRCALNRLMISQPEPDSVAVERELAALQDDYDHMCVQVAPFRAYDAKGKGRAYFPRSKDKIIRKGYDLDEEQGPVIPK